MLIRRFRSASVFIAGGLIVSSLIAGAAVAGKKSGGDSKRKLSGGEKGTLFESLRVEGEDRIRIEFERPRLNIDVDPFDAPGLEREGLDGILAASGVDFMSPFLQRSATERTDYLARPWLDYFSPNGVARFRPQMDGVERWRLIVANSAGDTVVTFAGRGKPPKEIVWDGRSTAGTPVLPGLTYSYVLQAEDRAGNKRNFVGDGFELPAYRLETSESFLMLFSADELEKTRDRVRPGPASGVILEAASWMNQFAHSKAPIRIEATARSAKASRALVDEIVTVLTPLFVGDPARIDQSSVVEAHAPDGGAVVIEITR